MVVPQSSLFSVHLSQNLFSIWYRVLHVYAGLYLTGGRGDMSSSLDFGVPLTGSVIESLILGGMPLIPLTGTNSVRQSVSDNKLLIAPTTTTMLLFFLY